MSKDYTRAIAYHSSSITIFWVLFLFLTLGFGLMTLGYYDKLNQQERNIAALNDELIKTQKSLISMQQKAVITKSKPVEVSVTVVPETGTNQLPAAKVSETHAPLERGALSPDGTKYAGYDDTTAGKLGIGVMTLADKRVRHIVLFNPKTENSGAVISSSMYGVRWLDKNTIQYDVLVTSGAKAGKETRTVDIGF